MAGPLSGLRVVECSSGMAGPRATGLLADHGADVIRVEPPGGDPEREALAIPYAVFNRGKRSVELDLATAAGRATLLDLISGADVLVESWAPGEGARLGLDRPRVQAHAPGAVHCSITGFGPEGPLRDVPAREALVHALVGSMGEQRGFRDGPIFQALPFASMGAAFLAAIGVLAALYRRASDGRGRHVETSLYDGALAYLSMMWGDTDDASAAPLDPGSYRLLSTSFACADEEYLGVHTGAVGAFGRAMAVLGLDDRIPPSPDGLDMGVPLTPEQKTVLDAEIHTIFASRPRAYWLERLLDADVCAVPHLRPGQVLDEPQAVHNRMSLLLDDPVLGPVEQVAPAIRPDTTPAAVRGPAPTPGQHTAEVLAELASRPAVRTAPTAGAGIAGRPLLDGLRILDLGAYYAGPYSSRLLADLGADVIKLEPLAGDQMRGLERVFRSAQAGKRSIAADLKDPEVGALRDGLIRWADVIHHNMRPGAAERLGLGYEQARAIRPDGIYLYAPGWGSSGPDMHRQSFAPMLSGYVGVGFEVGGQLNPPMFPLGNEDPGNGLLGAIAILMALVHRQRSGEGQRVENPQLNAAMTHMAHTVRRPDGEVLGAGRLDPLQLGFGALERLYQTADGWLCLAVETDAEIAALGRVAGLDRGEGPRLVTRADREANAHALGELLAKTFAAGSTAHWIERLGAAGVPAAEPVPHNCRGLLRDPVQQRSGRAAVLPHPVQGHVRGVGKLLRVSEAAVAPHRLAPELGEHTDEVLAMLGLDAGRIAALRERGSVR